MRRSSARLIRLLATVIGLALLPLGSATSSAAPKVRVVTTSKLEVRGAISESGQLEVNGKLVDDTGNGLRGVEVYVSIRHADGVATTLPEPPLGVKAGKPGEPWTVATDTYGTFAFKVWVDATSYDVSARVEKTAFASATTESVKVEPGKAPVELKVLSTPPGRAPWEIDLDVERAAIRVQATSQQVEKSGLVLVLRERERELARATTVAGVATFDLPTKAFGPPGVSELVFAFEGSPGYAAARERVFSKRTALARFLDVRPATPNGAVPSDGLTVLGRVASKDGAVASGVVEVSLGAQRVGVGPLVDGAFAVVTHFRAEKDGIATLTLRLLPGAEGWRAQEVDLPVRVRAPGPWRAVLAAFAGVALVFVLARSRRPPRTAPTRDDDATGDEVVRIGRRARAPKVIEVTVRDRRRRAPIDGAKVRASRPSAQAVEALGGGETDEQGRLRLVLSAPVRAGDQLLVTHRGFLPLAVELPKAAELELAVTRRRDAVLDGLLAWARLRLRRLPTQPTPRQVADVAVGTLAVHVREPARSWAGAVEEAAFGLAELDERAQRGIEVLADATTRATDIPPPPPAPPPPAPPPPAPPPPAPPPPAPSPPAPPTSGPSAPVPAPPAPALDSADGPFPSSDVVEG